MVIERVMNALAWGSVVLSVLCIPPSVAAFIGILLLEAR